MFFTKVFNLLNGESRWDNQSSFWDDVCFYDYVQKIMDVPEQKVPSEYYENAELPFFEVLKKIEPDIVIVLGKELFKELPPSDGEPGKTIKIRGIDEFIETWKYTINGKTVYAGGRIQHPSSRGFKKDIWIKLCSKFLKEYEKGNLLG
jgi:uracil-DNA glycosylase